MSDESSSEEPPPEAAVAGNSPALVLVSTPIGNLGDMTPRAIAALRAADVVLAEDTRATLRLLRALGVPARLESLHDHNEEARLPGLLARMRRGERMALVSDAGTPLISDPGYRLARAVIAQGLAVAAAPGVNAALTALMLSGLPPHPFLFLGFLPPRAAARRAALASLRAAEQAGLAATLILYEAPHRLAATLADAALVLGARQAAVARELTKRFEEVRRAALAELAAHYALHPARGEVTLVIGPAAAEAPEAATLDARLRAVLATQSLRDAAARVAGETGVARRAVYARALALAEEDQRSRAGNSASSRSRPAARARKTPPERAR